MEVNFSYKCDSSETIAQTRSLDNIVKVFNNQVIADSRSELHRNNANSLGNILNFCCNNKDLITSAIGLIFPKAAQKVKPILVFVDKLTKGELPIESEPEQPTTEQPTE